MKQQVVTVLNAWHNALQVKSFKIKLVLAAAVLVFCAWLAPMVFQYAEQRTGVPIPDFILDQFTATDLSLIIFLVLDTLLIISITALLTRPHHFLVVLQGYVLLTLVRFITILLVPLEAPEGLVLLRDPLTDRFFYGGVPITKDLFFSGHTSILFLMGFGLPFPRLKLLLFAGAVAVGVMLLIQHAHYTIDVVAAPVFAWLALYASRKIHRAPEKYTPAG